MSSCSRCAQLEAQLVVAREEVTKLRGEMSALGVDLPEESPTLAAPVSGPPPPVAQAEPSSPPPGAERRAPPAAGSLPGGWVEQSVIRPAPVGEPSLHGAGAQRVLSRLAEASCGAAPHAFSSELARLTDWVDKATDVQRSATARGVLLAGLPAALLDETSKQLVPLLQQAAAQNGSAGEALLVRAFNRERVRVVQASGDDGGGGDGGGGGAGGGCCWDLCLAIATGVEPADGLISEAVQAAAEAAAARRVPPTPPPPPPPPPPPVAGSALAPTPSSPADGDWYKQTFAQELGAVQTAADSAPAPAGAPLDKSKQSSSGFGFRSGMMGKLKALKEGVEKTMAASSQGGGAGGGVPSEAEQWRAAEGSMRARSGAGKKLFTNELLELMRQDLCKGDLRKFTFLGLWLADVAGGKGAEQIKPRGLEIKDLSVQARRAFMDLLIPLLTRQNSDGLEIHTEWFARTPEDGETAAVAPDSGEGEAQRETFRIWLSDKNGKQTSPFVGQPTPLPPTKAAVAQ